jgi:AcrR family transcriptional regulator
MPYHHGSLPSRLVTETRRALRERPDDPPSLREIARAIGVSANAPYRHFQDRAALLRAVAAEGYATLAAGLRGRSGSAAVARAWEDLASGEPALADLMTAPPGEGAGGEELGAAVGEWLGEVVAAVEREVGGDDAERLIRAATGCWAAVVGRWRLERAGAFAGLDAWMVPTTREMARCGLGDSSGRRPAKRT